MKGQWEKERIKGRKNEWGDEERKRGWGDKGFKGECPRGGVMVKEVSKPKL